MDVALLILRIVVGGLFIGHGTQKLFGWFGGRGLPATAASYQDQGFRPGRVNALMSGVAEAGGGLLLVLGLLTPLGAVGICAVMIVAAIGVHLRNGVWNQQRGYEINLVYATAAFVVAVAPGELSFDAALGLAEDGVWGLWWGLAALAVGAVLGFARLATRHAPAPAANPGT
jgi:putative oxidoreductase